MGTQEKVIQKLALTIFWFIWAYGFYAVAFKAGWLDIVKSIFSN